MHVLIVAFSGAVLATLAVLRARRYEVADRLRSTGSATTRRVPAWLRARMERALDAAALDVSAERACSTWLWTVAVAAAIGGGFGGAPVGAGLAVIAAAGAPVVVLSMHERRARQIAAIVPETLERVGSELRSGGTVNTAVVAIAAGDGPLAPDMTRLDTRLRLGASLSDALATWAVERPVAGVDAFAGALALCSSVGGKSADALDGLASSLRDRLGVAAEARALSAQARLSAVVVAGVPVAYIVWSALVDPHSLHVLTGTQFGRVCLFLGFGLEFVGGWWMRAIVRSGSAA